MRLFINGFLLLCLFVVAQPAMAQSHISCSSIDLTEKRTLEQLAKIQETCRTEFPAEDTATVEGLKDWGDVMRLYSAQARENSAALGMTPVQYMNSTMGQLSLTWLAMRIYAGVVVATYLSIMTFWFALLASNRITRRASKFERAKFLGLFSYWRGTEFEYNYSHEPGLAAWGTLAFGVIAVALSYSAFAFLT